MVAGKFIPETLGCIGQLFQLFTGFFLQVIKFSLYISCFRLVKQRGGLVFYLVTQLTRFILQIFQLG